MIEHLSAEQISQWMTGERTPQLEEHVAECAACRGELAQMESALSQFRTAMRDPANSIPPPDWREPAPSARWYSWSPRLVLVAAALVVLVAAPISWRVHVNQQASRAQAAAQAALADSQLLESVDSEISQAVPQPMEPLVTLATWNSSSAEQTQKAQR
jgi:predicted anti-sigma-YlaC factor YlaD